MLRCPVCRQPSFTHNDLKYVLWKDYKVVNSMVYQYLIKEAALMAWDELADMWMRETCIEQR
ncbi:hypothetical protein BSQ40_10090 [Serratia fonticola]|nr:hypothetical protein BSQ40_10090 [Serratia fonticola]